MKKLHTLPKSANKKKPTWVLQLIVAAFNQGTDTLKVEKTTLNIDVTQLVQQFNDETTIQ